MQPQTRESLKKISLGYSISLIALIVVAAVMVVSSEGAIRTLVASSASSLNGRDAVLFFAARSTEPLTVGQTITIDLAINSRVPINAVGASVLIPTERLEILGISKENSFLDLWTEETVIDEGGGALHFSGGTLIKGGHLGIGTLITITMRARTAGSAEISLSNASVYAHDGRGEALPSDLRTIGFTISEKPTVLTGAASTPTPTTPTRPSTDLNNDGKTSLSDLSILAIQLLAPYNARYDLDTDGMLSLRDLSILFSKMRE